MVVSFALQENFGYGIQEAAKLGVYPLVPNRLCYKEQFHEDHLYNDFDDCIEKLDKIITGKTEISNYKYHTIDNDMIFKQWFTI